VQAAGDNVLGQYTRGAAWSSSLDMSAGMGAAEGGQPMVGDDSMKIADAWGAKQDEVPQLCSAPSACSVLAATCVCTASRLALRPARASTPSTQLPLLNCVPLLFTQDDLFADSDEEAEVADELAEWEGDFNARSIDALAADAADAPPADGAYVDTSSGSAPGRIRSGCRL